MKGLKDYWFEKRFSNKRIAYTVIFPKYMFLYFTVTFCLNVKFIEIWQNQGT